MNLQDNSGQFLNLQQGCAAAAADLYWSNVHMSVPWPRAQVCTVAMRCKPRRQPRAVSLYRSHVLRSMPSTYDSVGPGAPFCGSANGSI